MGVFDRLRNVAKGKLLQWGRSWERDRSWGDEPAPRERVAREETSDEEGALDTREMLRRLVREGVLTEEEYAEKLDRLEGKQPRRRRL